MPEYLARYSVGPHIQTHQEPVRDAYREFCADDDLRALEDARFKILLKVRNDDSGRKVNLEKLMEIRNVRIPLPDEDIPY